MEESQFEIGDFQGIPMVTVRGDVDMHSAPDFRSAVDRAQGTHGLVIVDLRDCQFMDSSGLSVLLETAAKGIEVTLRSPSDVVRRVVETTGLTETLRMQP